MRESLMYGSVRGTRGNSRPYRDDCAAVRGEQRGRHIKPDGVAVCVNFGLSHEQNENDDLPENTYSSRFAGGGCSFIVYYLEFVMAPRAHWKGYLKLSLVSCPIALFPASGSLALAAARGW